jgi:hypothetical protein
MLRIISRIMVAAALLALVISVAPAQAPAQEGVKVGMLSCNVSSGWGFIFGSSREVNCSFAPAQGQGERYKGNIHKFGVDIGYSHAAVIVWAVFAPATDVKPGALAGDYGGVTASASAGVGVGGHVLVGGFNKTFTLQPASVEGNVGLNVAAGIEGLTLEAAR